MTAIISYDEALRQIGVLPSLHPRPNATNIRNLEVALFERLEGMPSDQSPEFGYKGMVLAFLLNFIPNLGSIIAAVPPVLLGYIQFGLGRALLVAVGYGVVNVIFGNVVEPKLMGRKLGLSTLVVFLSLVFWGWIWGPIGMLLSVPMTMIVKIALESHPSTRGLSILLDSESSVARTAKRQESASTG